MYICEWVLRWWMLLQASEVDLYAGIGISLTAQTKAWSQEALECFKCGTAKCSGDVNLAACLMRLIIRKLFQGAGRKEESSEW